MDTLVNARLSVDSYREEKSRIPNELIAVDGRAFVAILHFNDIPGIRVFCMKMSRVVTWCWHIVARSSVASRSGTVS